MKQSSIRFGPAITLLLLAAYGCGGSDHHSSSSSDTTKLTFTSGAGYNGLSGDLTGTPTAVASGTSVTITLANGARTVTATFPSADLTPGTTINATDTGVSIGYTEITSVNEGTLEKAWGATGGSITITSVSGGRANATVTALLFSPTTLAGNNAVGTFTADGKIVGVPIALPG